MSRYVSGSNGFFDCNFQKLFDKQSSRYFIGALVCAHHRRAFFRANARFRIQHKRIRWALAHLIGCEERNENRQSNAAQSECVSFLAVPNTINMLF